ncbi:Uncharacterized protein TCM_018978 [Theobroma cacao]|uniref:Reverse transcriptase domain-containing protein n=1 Tax=Theobroma cacao TaxID=3641 RepID=A0A061EFK2_THECC|nr:Uncharacterized protein TCM_018978 [Theobroma cacao]
MCFMRDFYSLGSLNININTSFTLVITCNNRSQYGLISLVRSIYKILVKILANRLKMVLHLVIDDNQFSFVKGKQILHCFFIANEVIDSIKKSLSSVYFATTLIPLVFLKEYKLVATLIYFSSLIVDDLIIFYKFDLQHLKGTQRILKGFKIIFSLKTIFSKSYLMGVNVDQQIVQDWAKSIECKARKLPTEYLGLFLGASHSCISGLIIQFSPFVFFVFMLLCPSRLVLLLRMVIGLVILDLGLLSCIQESLIENCRNGMFLNNYYKHEI